MAELKRVKFRRSYGSWRGGYYGTVGNLCCQGVARWYDIPEDVDHVELVMTNHERADSMCVRRCIRFVGGHYDHWAGRPVDMETVQHAKVSSYCDTRRIGSAPTGFEIMLSKLLDHTNVKRAWIHVEY